jgi:hypothetical protein
MQSEHHLETGTLARPVLKRHSGRRDYPLALNQQHMWFQCQLDLDSTLWNLGAKMRLAGALDVQAFIRAVQNTVDRHEILRSVFVVSDDSPVQRVLDHVQVECPVHQLPVNLSGRELEKEIRTRLSALADPVYDLETGPLIRTALLKSTDDLHYFIFAFHHLLLDAFYSGQLMKEIVAAYHLIRRNASLPPDPPLQYGDYCIWQDELWTQGAMAETSRFWQEQFAAPLPDFQLPTDPSVPFPRAVRSHIGLKLSANVARRLRDVGRQAKTTVFRVMLAAFALFFSSFSENGEVVLDIDFSTRPREMGHTIGFFANLLPVRLQINMNETFLELLRSVDKQLRDVSANRDFPVRQLIRKRKGHDAMQPLSPIVVTQIGVLDWSVSGLHMSGQIYVTASVHDLWLGVLERDEQLELTLAYSHELFDLERARKWVSWMEKTFDQVINFPDMPVSGLVMLEGALRELQSSEKGTVDTTSNRVG